MDTDLLDVLRGVLEEVTEDLSLGFITEGAAARIQEPVSAAIARAELAVLALPTDRAGALEEADFEKEFPPNVSAQMIMTTYGHPNWKLTGLEHMALIVARAFLSRENDK